MTSIDAVSAPLCRQNIRGPQRPDESLLTTSIIGTNQPEDLRSSIFGLGVSISYDFKDAFASDEDPWSRQSVKKRRGGDSPLSGIATRIGTRFPSFSRRWKGRKVSVGSTMDGAHRSGPLAASSRNSSTTHSTIDSNDYPSQYATPYPSSPTSLMDGGEQFDDDAASFLAPIDLERANDADDDMETDDDRCGDRRHATTPLLPPLMVPDSVATIDEECLQSPLQSPTIDTCGTFSIIHSPTEPRLSMTMTPVVGYMPSPPLSTQPSVSSLRYPTGSTTRPIASQLVPCDDIPQMKLADPEDEWSQKLGHANFDIHPEPYRPADLDSAEGRQHFHASWALARCSYTKHLVRTGEHYGATSITHQLTEQKWSEIDARWRAHNEELIRKNAAATGGDTVVLREETAGAATVVGIPSFLNELSAEGKFPRLGDQVIVGPMEQIASQLQRKRSRKQTLMKFIHDVKVPNIGFGLRLGRKRSKTQ